MVVACASLVLTVALVLTRPRLGPKFRVTPAMAAALGALMMLLARVVGPADVAKAAHDLWRPMVAVASIMISTALAHRTGIFDRLARRFEKRTRGPVHAAFSSVFLGSALTAAAFNNDAAILLLTPLVVPMIARLYPVRPYLVTPFAFAVFMSAGVAPLSTSNPMNLVVAERAGIGFNAYAARMVLVSLVAAVVSFLAIRWVYRKELDDPIPARGPERGSLPELEPVGVHVLVVLAATLAAYPVLSVFDGPVWVVAICGAVVAAALCLRARVARWSDIGKAVAWDVLVFVFFMFVVGAGLRNAGAMERLAELYKLAPVGSTLRLAVVGFSSAIGSAVLNNHPMSVLNVMTLEHVDGDIRPLLLAALVGGDLGPRLLPIGSLAGLLWLDALSREGVEIRVRDFVRIGVTVTLPALCASLAALAAVLALGM